MSRPRRLAAFSYQGTFAYSLTFCTFQRQRHFESDATVAVVRAQVLRTATERSFEVLAYCFMPDHLHLLTQGSDQQAHLPAFIKLLRQRASVASRPSRSGILWQEGYFERTLRGDDDLTSIASYIAQNPVRARLVERAQDWPFSGGTLLEAMWGRAGTEVPAYVPLRRN